MSAELLSHQAQAMQRGAAPIEFAPNPAFVIPAMSPMSIPQPNLPVPSNYRSLANLIYSPDGPRIPSLLLATQRTPYSQPVSATQLPVSCFNAPPAPDLASLMPNANLDRLFPPLHSNLSLLPISSPRTRPRPSSHTPTSFLSLLEDGPDKPHGHGPSSFTYPEPDVPSRTMKASKNTGGNERRHINLNQLHTATSVVGYKQEIFCQY